MLDQGRRCWEAEYKIVTPLFIGGADPKKEKDLRIRVPSIKGALRFWYRAIALGRLGNLEKVREKEAKLFGSTNKGQSAFLLRIVDENVKAERKNEMVSGGSAYLGYGVMDWNNKAKANLTTRSYIKPGSTYKLMFLFRFRGKDEIETSDYHDLKQAVIALGLFGGLGARSRRGLGSLALMTLKENGKVVWSAPQTVDELQAKYEEFFKEISLKDKKEGLPPYTAFSKYSRVAIVKSGTDMKKLHNDIGVAMNSYRSYRKDKNFPRDHDILLEIANRKEPQEHPARVVFGLPHNYFFSSAGIKADIDGVGKNGGKEYEYRRASPLFIHIHPVGSEFATVLIFIPAKFLPDGVNIKMSSGRNTVELACEINKHEDFHPITDFINSFPDRREVTISE